MKTTTLCDHCGTESGKLEDGVVDTVEGERVGMKCQALYAREAEETALAECYGHPAGPYDRLGETVYCDGSCR